MLAAGPPAGGPGRTGSPPSPDVAVVGGGVIGLATAWRAAGAGLAATVIDPAPGRGASWAAAGMLAPVTEVHFGEEALLRLNLASARRWPAFAAALEEATGQPSGYRRCGTLAVARDPDDRGELDRLHDFQRRLGLSVERLTSRETRRLEPALAPSVRGGLLVEGDHQVDNRRLVVALQDACQAAGVRLLRRRVAGVEVAGDRAVGVCLAGGERVPAGAVVLAAGVGSRGLDGLPAGFPPVRPVKGQLLHLRGPADPPLVTRNVRSLDVYLVPRGDGRLVVGATVEDQGFDTTVTAGAVLDLLRAAFAVVPDVTELALTETVAGLRPGSPDNAPLIGDGPLAGLAVATGHYRNGLLLAPLTADAVTDWLTEGVWPEAVAPAAPSRFGQPAVAVSGEVGG